MNLKRSRLTMLVGTVALLSLPVAAQETSMSDMTIAEIVTALSTGDAPEFQSLAGAIGLADPALAEALNDPEASYTVFAPTDAAFAALQEAEGDEYLTTVLADQEQLTAVLGYHVVGQAIMSSDIVGSLNAMSVMTFAGNTGIRLTLPTLQGQYLDFTQDEAGVVRVDESALDVSMIDIEASNGVIHVIDAVLLPETRTIGEILADFAALDVPEFTTLSTAVDAAGLMETVSSSETNPITVFAPTDAAFEALIDSLNTTAPRLLGDEARLTSILNYHVVPGIVGSDTLANAAAGGTVDEFAEWFAGATDGVVSLNTQNEDSLLRFTFDSTSGFLLNDTVRLIINDIDASNGLIHVVDSVLVPGS